MNWLTRLGMGVIALMSLSALALPTAANAASKYTGYYYDAPSPSVIADAVQKSLSRDSSGKTMLDPAKCKKDGSCATPLNYLESFRAHDPYGKWTLENMAQKMRQLVRDCTIQGNLQMDRIERATGRTDINGMTRHLAKGECAWVNPETHQPVLAQHCANPVGVRVDLNCVYVDFEARDAREFSVIWARYRKPTDQCFAFRHTTKVFEADSAKAAWVPVTPGCLGFPCNMENDNEFFHERDVAHGQIALPTTGSYQFRLEPGELLLLCLKLKHEDGSVSSSFGNRARWKTDYRLVGHALHARVYYQTNDMKADGRHINGPGGLAFYASTPEDEAMLQGITQVQ